MEQRIDGANKKQTVRKCTWNKSLILLNVNTPILLNVYILQLREIVDKKRPQQ